MLNIGIVSSFICSWSTLFPLLIMMTKYSYH